MSEYPDYRNPNTCDTVTFRLEEIFRNADEKSQKVRKIARRIRIGIEEIDPFVQQATRSVCPKCRDVCCINKHGYYDFEDLVYKADQALYKSKNSGRNRLTIFDS